MVRQSLIRRLDKPMSWRMNLLTSSTHRLQTEWVRCSNRRGTSTSASQKFREVGMQPALQMPDVREANQRLLESGQRARSRSRSASHGIWWDPNEEIATVLPLLLFLPSVIYGQSERLPPVDANVTSCLGLPLLAELTRTSGAAILNSYGYDLHAPWSCTRIDSPWAAGSSLLHFQKVSARTDDATAFSVMRVAGNAYIWVIPTESRNAGGSKRRERSTQPRSLQLAAQEFWPKLHRLWLMWNSVGTVVHGASRTQRGCPDEI